MRYSSGDLAILGAESYDVGVKYTPANRNFKRTKKTTIATVTEESQDEPARKRRKPSSTAGAGDDDDKKRSRGRPRLEPKDETAQDRRRTQIRLAQRAYRNRKESAIQMLERQVQELKDTKTDMTKAFLRFHDFAVAQGLLDRMPGVGRQLRKTTETFLKLSRPSTEDLSGQEDGDGSSPRNGSTHSQERLHSPAEVVEMAGANSSQPSEPQPPLFGGLIVTQEVVVPTTTLSSRSLELAGTALASSIPTPPTVSNNPSPPDYEMVTYPTLDNASFPFGFDADFTFPAPDLNSAPDFSSLGPSLYPSLPLPDSFASQEATFGRRFQRTALEHAVTLVSMADPPAHRFSRVFGFCLLFEPLDNIKARLHRGVDKTSQESLNYWQYPFHQLGGAGTRLDTSTTSTTPLPTHRSGNRGTTDVMRPRNGNGFAMGPFNEKVNAARDMLEGSQYLPVMAPQLGGEFYDSDEIEIYLYQRGVSIPGEADYVTVEVDEDAFTIDGGGLFGGFSDFRGTAAPTKRRLTVDVKRLILEMVDRSTCLGRSPGLKMEDINASFWKAVKPTV